MVVVIPPQLRGEDTELSECDVIVGLSEAALPGAVQHLVDLGGGGVETEVIKERLYLMLRDGGGGPQPGVPGSVQPLCSLSVHNDSCRHYYDIIAPPPCVPPRAGSHY